MAPIFFFRIVGPLFQLRGLYSGTEYSGIAFQMQIDNGNKGFVAN